MHNKFIIFTVLAAALMCSCEKEKYTDETFYRLEYTLGGDRFFFEDYGRTRNGLFRNSSVSNASGQGFIFRPVNDTVRLAGFSFNVQGFRLELSSDSAFFFDGHKYDLSKSIEFQDEGKAYICTQGDFSFKRLTENVRDRYLLSFNAELMSKDSTETIQVRDAFLTLCRRYTEKYTDAKLDSMILYEK